MSAVAPTERSFGKMPEISISELKRQLENPGEAVSLAEALYCERIDEIAHRIVESGSIRVVLLSGPSGSGKTTTANLIADRIRALGEKSMVISMDDFYMNLDDERYPRLENGKNDFESPDALDEACMLRTLGDIISGRSFTVPKYDFKAGGRGGFGEYPSFGDGCVIVEGIHALNPRFSDPFPKDSVLKVFVSVSTNIYNSKGRIISGKKLRFVRRAVRDSIYRGADVLRTLSMWTNVLKGEEQYLYPYKDTADVRFDTFHIFEPAVMKPYILTMLTDEVTSVNPYARAVREAMEQMPELPEDIVPQSSLIREFIPGGIYEELY